jgi:hypothetical protein
VRNLTRNHIPRHAAKTITGHLTDAVYERYDIVDEQTLAWVGEQMAKASPMAQVVEGLKGAPPVDPYPGRFGSEHRRKLDLAKSGREMPDSVIRVENKK